MINQTLDLSDDDDPVVPIDANNREVCLGRIENARVNAYKVPTPKTQGAFMSNAKHWVAMSVALHRRPGAGSNNIIAVRDPMGKEFGTIDPRIAGPLATMMDGAIRNQIRLQARLDSRPKKPFDYPGQSVSDNYGVTINIYAPRKFVAGIGRQLSIHQIWLRDPLVVDRGVEVVNPHKARDYTPKQASLSGGLRGSGKVIQRTVEETREAVFKVGADSACCLLSNPTDLSERSLTQSQNPTTCQRCLLRRQSLPSYCPIRNKLSSSSTSVRDFQPLLTRMETLL